ncbi:unnamed protein product [Closterium sp. NIES-54]
MSQIRANVAPFSCFTAPFCPITPPFPFPSLATPAFRSCHSSSSSKCSCTTSKSTLAAASSFSFSASCVTGGTNTHVLQSSESRSSSSSGTTDGSASVLRSPSSSSCRAAILRSTRRMILPLRVLGRCGAQWMWSGAAKAPICERTVRTSSRRRSSAYSTPDTSVTYAYMPCPFICVGWCTGRVAGQKGIGGEGG